MKHSFLLVTLVCAAGWMVGWNGGYLDGLSKGWLVTAVALTAPHFLMEPLRWQVYGGSRDLNRLTIFYHVFSSTAFLSYLLPAKLGLPLRYWLISRYQGMSPVTVGVHMAIDGVLSLVTWTIASIALGGHLVLWLIEKYAVAPGGGSLSLVLVTVALSLILFSVIGRGRGQRILVAVRRGVAEVSGLRIVCASLLFTADIAGYVLRHAAILAALSAPDIGWQALGTATVLSIYAGFLCMLPMGLVGYDAVVIVLLAQYGVPVETAAMVPIINRSANILVGITLGLPSSLKLGLAISRKSIGVMLGESRNEK